MTYEITIRPSGQTFQANDNESILDAALRHGFALPHGCRNGACGSCKGKLLSGHVKYPAATPVCLRPEDLAANIQAFCQACPTSAIAIEVAEIGATKDITIKTLPCRVQKMDKLASDVMRLMLRLPSAEIFNFLPGQYIDILLKEGKKRSFSIANAPQPNNQLELHIRLIENGFFTQQVFNEMQEKALLRFEGPFGNFFLREDSQRPIIFIAGSTGFAPIKSILEDAFQSSCTRQMHLFWGVKHRELLYLDTIPAAWQKKYANFHYTPVLSEPADSDQWQGATGLVHQQVLSQFHDLANYDIYASGPPALIQAITSDFSAHGLQSEQFYFDAFDFNS